jgi:pyruvate dehydrogenase E2 component (dihydrolipoamide acetyltransferase)
LASQVILPKLTYEMQVGRIYEWLCAEGQEVSTGQPLFVIETDKATDEVPAEEDGVLLKILVPAGIEIPVGTVVAWIGRTDESLPVDQLSLQNPMDMRNPSKPFDPTSLSDLPGSPSEADTSVHAPEEIMITPLAKRLARQLGVDLRQLAKETGRTKIREADIQAYVDRKKEPDGVNSLPSAGQPSPLQTAGSAQKVKHEGSEAEYKLIQPTPLQKAMKVRMSESANIPQMAAGCEVDLTGFERFRDEHQADWEKKFSYRLSYTHLLAALVSKAVKLHPMLNASWTEQGIRLYRSVGLGVAMATERGLIVPVVHSADELSLEELAAEIVRLQMAAKNNRLGLQDLDGGTFTLTNVGMIGIELSVPLIYPPQSAIMGVGAGRTKLVLDNGLIKSIGVMTITVVCDHRLVDGVAQGAFLQTIKGYIENPTSALSS